MGPSLAPKRKRNRPRKLPIGVPSPLHLPCHSMLWHAAAWHATACHGTPWDAIACHGMPVCHGVRWHAMECRAIPWHAVGLDWTIIQYVRQSLVHGKDPSDTDYQLSGVQGVAECYSNGGSPHPGPFAEDGGVTHFSACRKAQGSPQLRFAFHIMW